MGKVKRIKARLGEKHQAALAETVRIARNARFLLKVGLFSGEAGPAIAECQEWLDNLVGQMEADLPKEKSDGKKTQKPLGTPQPAHQ